MRNFLIAFFLLWFGIQDLWFVYGVTLSGIDSLLLGDIDFIYQFPPVPKEQMKGIVFLAHGCHDGAASFWPKSDTCKKCNGKSLTQSLTRIGLQHNYAVFASNAHNKSECWEDEDAPRLITLFHHFYKNVYQDKSYTVPLHLLGVCNGGVVLGQFLQNSQFIDALKPIRVASFGLTISAFKINPPYSVENKFPIPTFFLPMERDLGIYWNIRNNIHLFENAKMVVVEPVPMTKEFIYNTSMGSFTWKESEELYNVLKKHQVIDEKDYVKQDPISFNYEWRQIIANHAPKLYKKDVENYVHSVLGQLLRSAYAHHGLAVRKYDQIFDFFDSYSAK